MLAVTVGLSISSIAIADDINWLPAGAANYNVNTNWQEILGLQLVPDVGFDDVATINSGGTAEVIDTPTSPGGVKVVNGTLDITATGNLSVLAGGDSAPGDVTVSSGGRLNVAGGGTLSVVGALDLGGTFTAELTASAQIPVRVPGAASLGSAFIANFNGASTAVGTTWDLIDAGTISGGFDSVSVQGHTFPLGQGVAVQQLAGGANGNLLQLSVIETLVLQFDRATGIGSILNPGTATSGHSLDGYAVESAVGSINPANWSSFEDNTLDGGTWEETGSGGTSNALAELNSTSSGELAIGASRGLGSIYIQNFSNVAFGEDAEDHVFTYHTPSGQTLEGVIDYIGDKQENNIVLTVDPTSGNATMQNESGSTVEIDSYSIGSDAGGLLTSYSSLEDQGVIGGVWLEANTTANRVSEVMSQPATTLSQDQGFELDGLTGISPTEDLTFQFLIAGTTEVLDGVVQYGNLPTVTTADANLGQAR